MDNMQNLIQAEERLDCVRLIHYFDIERSVHQCSFELYARVVFILIDNLAEGMDATEPVDYYQRKMLEYYLESSHLYGDILDYQFLFGFIVTKGEWFFGIEDLNDAVLMRKRPYQIQPSNSLYKWLSLNHGDPDLPRVAQQLIVARPDSFVWLESLGVLGQYIIGIIEANASGK